MVALDYYVQAFQTSNSDRYHWVCFPVDHFLIDGPDLVRIERPETVAMHQLHVEVCFGDTYDDGDDWWALREMPFLADRYSELETLGLLVDQSLISWNRMLVSWSDHFDVYVVEVHSGECVHLGNCIDYYDWYCAQNGLEHLRTSVQFNDPDGDVERYTSDVCPAKQLDGWVFPSEPSLNWGTEGEDWETVAEDSE